VDIYDTTLRDGTQLEGISLTVDDKLRIAEQLDHLGVAFIEGGWPGANPKDDEFFERARTELDLQVSELVAFGSTRRARGRVDSDQVLAHLAGAGTSTVCIVGKCWDYHVTEALQTTLDEGVAMVADSVEFLAAAGKRVLFDAEHFFDGFRRNPEFSLRVLEAAAMAGASTVVLCDTSGSMDPYTRFLLTFVLSLGHVAPRTEVFAFNTSLTRLTPWITAGNVAATLRRFARNVDDWSGGTRIGECLREFADDYLRPVVAGDTSVLIFSDGLDRGDTDALEEALLMIRRRARRVIWLNPLMGDPRYRPEARGMKAALPHIDDLVPAHNLESLEALLPMLQRS